MTTRSTVGVRVVAIVVTALGVTAVRAGEPAAARPKISTPVEAAAETLAARLRADEEALRKIAARARPDVWFVADELWSSGEKDAVSDLVRLGPPKDVERLLAAFEPRRADAGDTSVRAAIRKSESSLRDRDGAAALLAVADLKPPADGVLRIRLAWARGMALQSQERLAESTQEFEWAAHAAESLGWLRRASEAYEEVGGNAYDAADYKAALAPWEKRVALDRARDDEASVAKGLGNVAILHEVFGDATKAITIQREVLVIHRRHANHDGIAATLVNIGNILVSQSAFDEALKAYREGRSEADVAGRRDWAANAHMGMGVVYEGQSEYRKAAEQFGATLALRRELGDADGIAAAISSLGAVAYRRGDLASALDLLEDALRRKEARGRPLSTAGAHVNLGNVHWSMGNPERAIEHFRKGLALVREQGDRRHEARILGDIGLASEDMGDLDGAIESYRSSMAALEALGDLQGALATRGNLGSALRSNGDLDGAKKLLESALEAGRARHDPELIESVLVALATCDRERNDLDSAELRLREALTSARSSGSRAHVVGALTSLANVEIARGRPKDAITTARQAVEELRGLARGLADEQSARVRSQFAGAFEVGARAAVIAGDLSEAARFFDAGRAGALLEALGGRDALREDLVPENLRIAEAAARAAEAAAHEAYGEAMSEGVLAKVSARRIDVESARGRLQDALEAIQRNTRGAALLLDPTAETIGTVQGRLSVGDVFVEFASLTDRDVALVIGPKEVRLVSIGAVGAAGAIASIATEPLFANLGEGDEVPTQAYEALRARFIAPLGLPPGTRRVFVSPDGELAWVPFGALLPDLEVALEPSATTFARLSDYAQRRGEGILALGDPAYPSATPVGRVARVRGGAWTRLPGSGIEARSVSEDALTGAAATRDGLVLALSKRPRWRAVHLACHGRIDLARPSFSGLALAPNGADDGFVSLLDVFRMRVPTDLVVLSACETARGKLFRGEGVVGPMRAFLFAGASCVICSLWKVDDEATGALMTKFYESWNPKTGSTGLGTAEALRKAQEFIRSQEKWKHPRFWAPWVLWGVPN